MSHTDSKVEVNYKNVLSEKLYDAQVKPGTIVRIMDVIEQWIAKVEKQAEANAIQQERQFILNVLDGIDIANQEAGIGMDTKAIRFCLSSRWDGRSPDPLT